MKGTACTFSVNSIHRQGLTNKGQTHLHGAIKYAGIIAGINILNLFFIQLFQCIILLYKIRIGYARERAA
jgi:hypothetical protein